MADGSIEAKTIDDFGPRGNGEKALVQWAAEKIPLLIFSSASTRMPSTSTTSTGWPHATTYPGCPTQSTSTCTSQPGTGGAGLPSSYSLRNLTNFFNLERKKESMTRRTGGRRWLTLLAMVALRIHCEEDVDRTALLWQRMKGYYSTGGASDHAGTLPPTVAGLAPAPIAGDGRPRIRRA